MASASLEERFWRFVPAHARGPGCWEWVGSRDGDGYGRIHVGGRPGRVERAHRVSWRIHHGPIPSGKVVAHECGSHACVRPDHLRVVSRREAMQMAVRRGGAWAPRGERNGRARLTAEEVAQVRNLAARGRARSEIARQYGVARSTLGHILAGRRRRFG